MRIHEAQQNDELLEDLIAMSADWEAENNCYGYRKNDRSDIAGNRIFLAEQDGEVLGYLFGNEEKSERAGSIMADGTPYFEIEELYVEGNDVAKQMYEKFGFVETKRDGDEIVMERTL